MRPARCAAASIAACTDASSVTSRSSTSIWMRSAAAIASSASRAASLRPRGARIVASTRCPRRASRTAASYPKPLLDPVIRITWLMAPPLWHPCERNREYSPGRVTLRLVDHKESHGHVPAGPAVRVEKLPALAGVPTGGHHHAGARDRGHDRDFSTLNAVLLKPLPYPQPENLYNTRTTLTDGRVTTGMLSNGEISRLNGTTSTIVHAAGAQPVELTLLHEDGTPQHIKIY